MKNRGLSPVSLSQVLKHTADQGWMCQIVDDEKSEPVQFLSLILHEPNGTKHNILYSKAKSSANIPEYAGQGSQC